MEDKLIKDIQQAVPTTYSMGCLVAENYYSETYASIEPLTPCDDIEVTVEAMRKTIANLDTSSFHTMGEISKKDIRVDPIFKKIKVYEVTYEITCNTVQFMTDSVEYESKTFYAESLEEAKEIALLQIPSKYSHMPYKVDFLKEEEYSDSLDVRFTYRPKIAIDSISAIIQVKPV